jgi:hypothetical protein
MKPETIAILVTSGVAGVFLFRTLRLQDAPTPDPWDQEIEAELRDGRAEPLCLKCLTPHSGQRWFCTGCGAPVGEYNNWMPYLSVFSEGEVLRTGVDPTVRRSPIIIAGFILYSLTSYTVFAPVYWWRLYQNLKRSQKSSGGLVDKK